MFCQKYVRRKYALSKICPIPFNSQKYVQSQMCLSKICSVENMSNRKGVCVEKTSKRPYMNLRSAYRLIWPILQGLICHIC
jgi:hypothetical protein